MQWVFRWRYCLLSSTARSGFAPNGSAPTGFAPSGSAPISLNAFLFVGYTRISWLAVLPPDIFLGSIFVGVADAKILHCQLKVVLNRSVPEKAVGRQMLSHTWYSVDEIMETSRRKDCNAAWYKRVPNTALH